MTSIKNQASFLKNTIVDQLSDFSKGILQKDIKEAPEQSIYGQIDDAIKRDDGQAVRDLSRYLTMLFMTRV